MNDDDLVQRLRDHGERTTGVTVSREQVWDGVRRRRRRTLAAAAAGTTAVVVGVGVAAGGWPGGAGAGPSGPDGVVQAAVEHRGSVLTLQPGDLTARDVADAQTAFGFDLLHAVCAATPGENVVLSPTSAAEAIGMVQPGSERVSDAGASAVSDDVPQAGSSASPTGAEPGGSSSARLTGEASSTA